MEFDLYIQVHCKKYTYVEENFAPLNRIRIGYRSGIY